MKSTSKDRFIIMYYENVDEQKWDTFVQENSLGYVNYLYKFIQIDEEETQNISFAIFDTYINEILLVMPLYIMEIIDDKNNKKKYKIICRKGLVIKDNLGDRYRDKISKFFVSHINYILEKYENIELQTELPALSLYNLEGGLINPLVFLGFKPEIRYTWVVDLKKSESKILDDCEETTRRAIKRYCEDNEFYFYETNERTKKQDLEDFYELSKIIYGKSSMKPKSKIYYKHLITELSSSYSKTFFLRRRIDDKPVVAAIILIYNHTARYSLGCSAEDKPNRISKYFIYRIMLELKKIGIEYFETGGAYPYLPDSAKMKGISDFKKCFGTFLRIIHRGVFYKQ